MSRHIFPVRFPDDAECLCICVRYVSDRVSVQRGLVGDGTNLLDRKLRSGLCSGTKGHVKCLVVAEGYVGTRTQASSGLLGRRGGILGSGLRKVLIQPDKYITRTDK